MAPPPPPKKGKGPAPTEADEPTFRSRARGSLLGLAVGEALGVPTRGKSLPAELFPKLNEYPIDYLKGGGAYDLKRGQTSWATHMAVCLANTLRAERTFDVFATGKAYAQWSTAAFALTDATKQALDHIHDGRTGEFSGRRVFMETPKKPIGNDALARCAPLAVFYPKQKEDRRKAALSDAAITHFHPLCRVAASTFAGVLAAALTTPKERLEKAELLKIFETELGAAGALLGQLEPDYVQYTKDAVEDLRLDFKFAQQDDPQLYGPDLHLFQQAGSTRVSFRLAFWELFHAPDYRAGVLDVVNRGGDADTTAAITGALLGAVYGEPAIPEEWREQVLEAVGPMGGAWWNTWHPRYLLNLVGATPEQPPITTLG